MQYRKFGELDYEVSALGFGCMRLPTDGGEDQIVEEEARRMVRYAIDHGVNYLDTAYPYHGGESERFVGRVLQDGYREKVKLATKLPCWEVEEYEDFDRLLNEQLEKLQTDHVDFYLLHALDKESWRAMQELDVFEWAEGAIEDGRIRHLGFSFHDEYEVFEDIVDGYDGWDFCQIQYNYMNEDYQAGTRGLEYAASKGLAVVVMEPLLGGKLVDPPRAVQEIWDEAPVERSAPDWALQWLWNKPEVSVVLSGMSTMQHVVENVESASHASIGQLSDAELEIIGRVRDKYDEIAPIPCTQCRYCMPCPNGVDIPDLFYLFNQGILYDAMGDSRWHYDRKDEGERASACIQCHVCEDKCPQHICISEWMPIVEEVLGEGQSYDPSTRPGV